MAAARVKKRARVKMCKVAVTKTTGPGRRKPPETSIPLTTLTEFIIPLPTRAATRIAIGTTMTIVIATVPSLTAALYPTTATKPTTAIVPPTGEVC